MYLFWLHWVLVVAFWIFSWGTQDLLVVACGLLNCDTHVGSSFLTRDRNWAPCIGSADSYSLDQQSPTFLAPGTSSVEDNFSMDGWWGGVVQAVMWAMGSDGEQWGAADEASLARPPLTSCCAVRFLTGLGPVPVWGLGVVDPCTRPPGKSQHLL